MIHSHYSTDNYSEFKNALDRFSIKHRVIVYSTNAGIAVGQVEDQIALSFSDPSNGLPSTFLTDFPDAISLGQELLTRVDGIAI